MPESLVSSSFGASQVLKERHYDPWNWHEYLGDDPIDVLEDDEDEDDVEMVALKPKAA